MNKRIISILCVLSLLIILILPGCGEDNSEQKTSKSSEKTSEYTPLMWKVEGKNGNTLYLFGTIHCGDERSDEVLEQISDTVKSCDKLAVEFDVVDYNEKVKSDPLSAADDLAQFMYTDGTTIKDHISEKLYKDCVKIMKDANLYNSLLDYYNSAYWSQVVTQALIAKSDYSTEKAMDSLLLNLAKESGIEIAELESASYQYELLNSFSDEFCEYQLESDVKSKNLINAQMKLLYTSWLDGDEDVLEQSLLSGSIAAAPEDKKELIDEYYDTFLYGRNKEMAKKAEKFLEGKDDVFFAVGAAHMLGENGIVMLLKESGCSVEKIES